MFGSGPSEEIRLESKTVQQQPPDPQESQARFDEHLDREHDETTHGRQPSTVERLKQWFSARF
ncbi:MAG TPA: hypothetical protein VH371_09945 [Candidatus Limnocylindrales bacterium]